MVARATSMTKTARQAHVAHELEAAFAEIRAEHGVREQFPAAVLAAAEHAARHPRLPTRDERDIDFITIDPPGAMDLDQALHITRTPHGYLVRYAIADLLAFITPGDPVDAESRLRGQSVYSPDLRVPLHPPAISEDAASLLPGVDRPAYVWEIELDDDGVQQRADVFRAMVRSRRRLTYEEVQHAVVGGTGGAPFELLRTVGELRVARESARGGASLPMPEQEVHVTPTGRFELRLRPMLAAEEWNAQISLLTGIAAGRIMLDAGFGILRTMPPADPGALARFRHEARALGTTWPSDLPYGDFLRSLDRDDPRHLAIIHDATVLFRGSGYTVFDAADAQLPVPEDPAQAAIAAPYAHTTAPLRRLVDRFSLAICETLTNGQEIPDWVRATLDTLPEIMAASARRTSAVDRQSTDAVEAAVLSHRLGEVFDAVVVDTDRTGLDLQLTDPAVVARADGAAEPGDRVRARLVTADVKARAVRLHVVDEVSTSR